MSIKNIVIVGNSATNINGDINTYNRSSAPFLFLMVSNNSLALHPVNKTIEANGTKRISNPDK